MKNRLSLLRKLMKTVGMEACLIKKPENIYYLSGLEASEANIIVTAKSFYLVVDSRYYLKAKKSSDMATILLVTNFESFLSEFLKEKGIKSLVIESDFLTYGQVQRIKKNISAKLIALEGFADGIREIKDDKEIKKLKIAAKIADKAIAFAKHSMRVGVSEVKLAKEIECFIRKSGARSESFKTIVASGANSALPHHSSGNRRIKPGDIVLIDLGVKYKNYVSDITRTFLLEPVNSFLKHMYIDCYKAQNDSLKKIVPGIKTTEIDKIARQQINQKSKGKFLHNLGHGIGLEVHEKPAISPKIAVKLAENMVFTIEPGIYVKGKGGIRIEDMVMVTKSGAKLLTKAYKKLEDMIVEL